MAELKFEDLSFNDFKDTVKVTFLKIYYFNINKAELEKIGRFEIKKNSIIFDISEKKAQNKFNIVLEKGFTHLKNAISNNPAYYIHKNSGIPLIGLNSIGLVDRNTNIIEIKPLTNCNMGCIFCSVDEGIQSKKKVDYVVEKDYLIQEFRKIAELKRCNDIEALFNPNGEPTLYAPLVDAVKDLRALPYVKEITINTNGSLLNETLIKDLADAGMTRINLSLNAVSPELARKLEGTNAYNPERVQAIIRYATKFMDVNIAPVYVKGFNDEEMDKICEFVLDLRKNTTHTINLGIQNMLAYQFGRNPAKETPWPEFYDMLKVLETKHRLKLIFDETDFNIHKTEKLEKPFERDDTIRAAIVLPGRIKGERIATAKGRLISVVGCTKENGDIKVKLIKDKHNIFFGKQVG